MVMVGIFMIMVVIVSMAMLTIFMVMLLMMLVLMPLQIDIHALLFLPWIVTFICVPVIPHFTDGSASMESPGRPISFRVI